MPLAGSIYNESICHHTQPAAHPEGLINAGMGNGLALLLLPAGLALLLPNMPVIRGVIGTEKTVVYVALVVIMATISGFTRNLFFKGEI